MFARSALAIVLLAATTQGFLHPRPSAQSVTLQQSTSVHLDANTHATDSQENLPPMESANTIICGGGPTGLLAAIMLAQKYPKNTVQVVDRLQEPLSPTDDVWNDVAKFYLIGLGGRGQTSLEKFGVWDEVEAACTAVVGRKDWSPGSEEGVERIFDGRKFTTQVLPRDKLVGVLYKHIQDNYADQIKLKFGCEVAPTDFAYDGDTSVLVDIVPCNNDGTTPVQQMKTDFLIAADGTSRTIANQMEESDQDENSKMNPIQRLFSRRSFRVKRYPDDNQRIYKTIPLNLPADWRFDLNYSARSDGGRVNLDALPANRDGGYCGVLLLRKDDEMAQANVDPEVFKTFMNEYLPQFTEIMDDETMEQVAQKPPSFLPSFRYVGPRLNQGKRTLLLGDCAHTVKPYFGLGANSAMEDVKILSNILDETDSVPAAVQKFSKQRAKEAKTLVTISRSLDRPGFLGAITFIIPIILDSIFTKIAPKIFSPNIISMLQKDDMTFRAVAAKKRLDRILQLAIIGAFLAGMAKLTTIGIQFLATTMGRHSTTVAAGLFGVLVGGAVLKKIAGVFRPGMAPADVLTKTKSNIGGNDKLSTASASSTK